MNLRRGASIQQRALEAIRRHFRDYGGSPSHREIALAVGIRPTDVGRVLRHLACDGLIILRINTPRGICLPDRAAMLSDSELILACIGRGIPVHHQAPASRPLSEAFPVEPVTDCGLPFRDILADIDAAEGAARAHDASTGQAGSGATLGDPADGRPAHARRRGGAE